jgi:hypothetical protein
MADGSQQGFISAQLVAGQPLRARCRCGREAAVDPAPWLAQRLTGAPLADLEDRLRCLCGARRASLRPGGAAAPAAARAIWIFR